MVVNFSNLNLKEKPTLILKNLDGTPIQSLGYAFDVEVELCYNEVSTLTFKLPKIVNGSTTPHYDDVIGMRLIDLKGCGLFILINPEEESDGLSIIKTCKAYSLEYEFTKKNMFLESGTFNFYDGVIENGVPTNENTIVGAISALMPDWGWNIDITLLNKYRTFDDTDNNIYDFMKNTIQETYGCIFDFDTYDKTIKVINVNSEVTHKQVYLSEERLLKNVKVSENSDDIVTCLDVYGADDVDIRSVNPTSSNKIYNIDAFLNTTNFTQETIDAWNSWQESCDNYRLPYYNLTIEYNLKLMQVLTAEAALEDINIEITALENTKAVQLQAIDLASDIFTRIAEKINLRTTNNSLAELQIKLAAQKIYIEILTAQRDLIYEELKAITDILDMENNFTSGQLSSLKKYFIESSLEDNTFVMSSTSTFNNTDLSSELASGTTFTLSGIYPDYFSDTTVYAYTKSTDSTYNSTKTYYIKRDTINDIPLSDGYIFEQYVHSSESWLLNKNNLYFKEVVNSSTPVTADIVQNMMQITGGNLSITTNNSSLSANIVGLTVQYDKIGSSGGNIVLTGYLENGTVREAEFKTGTITITGNGSVATTTASLTNKKTVTLTLTSGRLYFTRNNSEYEKHQVEWDLFEYAETVLTEKSTPTYEFSVESGNFLSIDDYIDFQNQFELGKRVYLKLGNTVYEPYVISAKINYEDLSKFSIDFSSTYSSFDSSFSLAKLLEKSVSMGKSLSINSSTYAEYVSSGASDKLKSIIEDALDLAKNAVISTGNQAVSFDDAGLKLRTYSNQEKTEYNPKQIWAINNMIAFTEDGWETSNMAIGEIFSKNMGKYIKVENTEDYDSSRLYFTREFEYTQIANTAVYDSTESYYVQSGSHPDYVYTPYNYNSGTWNTDKLNLYTGDYKYTLYTYKEDTWASDKLNLYRRTDSVYGICAPQIVGTLLAGQNLSIDTANGSFKVDESGVYIDSLKFYITHGGSTYDTTLGSIFTKNASGYVSADNSNDPIYMIDTTVSAMKASNGNVLFDKDGIWLMNEATKGATTSAVWMNESGISFGKGEAGKMYTSDAVNTSDRKWTWNTSLSYDGVFTGGVIKGSEIKASTIYATDFYTQPETVNESTSFSLKRYNPTDINLNYNLKSNNPFISWITGVNTISLNYKKGTYDALKIAAENKYFTVTVNNKNYDICYPYVTIGDPNGFDASDGDVGNLNNLIGLLGTLNLGYGFGYLILSSNALVLNSTCMYGDEKPSGSGVEGQLYFQY